MWSELLKIKYLKGIDLVEYLKYPVASNIWKKIMASLHVIKRWLSWQIGCGKQVILGCDSFIGDNDSFKFSGSLIQNLNNKKIYSLAQVATINDASNN